MPSQLKTRTRSGPSCAASPAVRWIVSMPMLAPAPASIAATQSSTKPGVPPAKLAATASSSAPTSSPTAMCTGRW